MLHCHEVVTAFWFYLMLKGFLNPNSSCTWRKTELVSKRDLLQVFTSWFMSQYFFFPLFPFLNSPAPELKENQNSAVALALPSRHLVQDQRDMESSTARLRSLSPGPPLQRSHFGREDVKEPEEILTPTEKVPPLERGIFAERLKGGLLYSLVLPQRQQTTAHVSCGTPYTQEDTQEVHHYCSPTAKLPLEHLTVKQRRKTQLKMKGANYVP